MHYKHNLHHKKFLLETCDRFLWISLDTIRGYGSGSLVVECANCCYAAEVAALFSNFKSVMILGLTSKMFHCWKKTCFARSLNSKAKIVSSTYKISVQSALQYGLNFLIVVYILCQ